MSDIEYSLINKSEHVKCCIITVFENGRILLNWTGEVYGMQVGETGFFLSFRAAKMYVTKKISKGKSKWSKILEE